MSLTVVVVSTRFLDEWRPDLPAAWEDATLLDKPIDDFRWNERFFVTLFFNEQTLETYLTRLVEAMKDLSFAAEFKSEPSASAKILTYEVQIS